MVKVQSGSLNKSSATLVDPTSSITAVFCQEWADCIEGPEGVKWDWDWPKTWVGKWDLIYWDWDFCTGNGTQNIKWEWEFCFNPLSKKSFFRIKFKQKSNSSR